MEENSKFNDLISYFNKLTHFIDNMDKYRGKVFSTNVNIEIYSLCYNLCVEDPDNNPVAIYEKQKQFVKSYLVNYCNNIKEFNMTNFIKIFNNLQIINRWMSKVLQYINRFYVENKMIDSISVCNEKTFYQIAYIRFKTRLSLN